MYDDDADDAIDAYALSDGTEIAGAEMAPEDYGPASGGYDAFRDGGGDENDDDEIELRREEERRAAKEEALRKRGTEERQYYDGLAKEADQKRRRMEAEVRAERLKLNDLVMKRSRLERERAGIERELDAIRASEELIGQKQYRREGLLEEDRAIHTAAARAALTGETPKIIAGALGEKPLTSIERREIAAANQAAELELAGASREKEELERRRAELESELGALSATIAERQRALSLKEHALRRIV